MRFHLQLSGLPATIPRAVVALLVVGLLPLASHAVTTLDTVDLSPDITVDLSGQIVQDEDVAEDDQAGTATLVNIGAIPANTDVTGYHLLDNGDQLLAFETTVTLPGGLTARPSDVVRFDGTTFTLEFDGAANGVPDGARVDAITVDSNGYLVLSFDTTVTLSGTTFTHGDLVQFTASTFSLFFDAAAAGVPTALDLDAAHYLSNGNLLLSFDGSGMLGGVSFDDEDVLEFTPSSTTWEMAYDGSLQHAGWPAGDLDALHASVTALVCDLNNDAQVDINDVQIVMAARNTPASGSGDPRDLDGDGTITVLDARKCVLECTNPRCAP